MRSCVKCKDEWSLGDRESPPCHLFSVVLCHTYGCGKHYGLQGSRGAANMN